MSVHVNEISICNFKSFAGKVNIGPLKPQTFSAIIGLNGTGKSNIIDAIAFCMGEKSKKLRSQRIEDLINKSTNTNIHPTYVVVKFQFENGEKKSFKRSVYSGKSQYEINEKAVSKIIYQNELRQLSINISASNFIVYQNDISSWLLMNPKERSVLFEEISGSIKFKKKYDDLKSKIEEFSNQIKGFRDEKKFLNVLKTKLIISQADKNKQIQLRKDYEMVMIELTLFELYIIELRCKHDEDDRKRISAEIENIYKIKDRLEVKKQKMIELNMAARSIEDKINNAQFELDNIIPNYTNNQDEINILTSRLEKLKRSLALATEAENERIRQVKQLEENKSELKEAKERFIQNYSHDFETNEEKMEELDRKYNNLRKIVLVRANVLYQELNSLEYKKQPFLYNIENETRKRDDIKRNIERKKEIRDSTLERLRTKQNYIEEIETKIQNLSSMCEELNSSEKKRLALESELRTLTDQLNDNEMSKQEKDKISQNERLVEILNHEFSKIHNFIYNLVKPKHERYKMAFTKIFAPYFLNIVVDDAKTAIECIKYLKLHQMKSSTFLPLDQTLRVYKLKDQLRSFEEQYGIKGVKLLYDVIDYPQEIERAVQHIVGNILVCETTKIAMHVAYKLAGGPKYNCVALDGTYYKKSGILSGGMICLQEKSKLLDVASQEIIERRKDQICMTLRTMHINNEKADTVTLTREIEQLKKTLSYYNLHLREIQKDQKNVEMEIKKLENDLFEIENLIPVIQTEAMVMEEKLKNVQLKINRIEDDVFANFCIEANLPNIRKYKTFLKAYKEKKLKESEYDEQYERIQNLLAYEKSRSKQNEIDKLLNDINDVSHQIVEQQNIHIDLKKKYNHQNDLLKEHVDSLSMTTIEIEKLEKEIEMNEKNCNDMLILRLTQKQKSLASNLLELLRKRHSLLLEAKMNETSLPLLENASLSNIMDQHTMEEGCPSIDDSLIALYEIENELKLDYSCLTVKPSSIINDIEICQMRTKYKQKINILQSRIFALNPSTKASQELEKIEEKLKELNHRIKIILKLCKDAESKFNKIKSDRLESFLIYFEPVIQNVYRIYKDITGHESAEAILFAENPNEPYLSGIYFNCRPWNKRYGSEYLSGGEMALGTLSLIFAIQSINPSPFLLLDEVDAALDASNRNKIIAYINKAKHRQQIIAISFHKNMFSQCETLIAVPTCDDNDLSRNSSLIILDLSIYSQVINEQQ